MTIQPIKKQLTSFLQPMIVLPVVILFAGLVVWKGAVSTNVVSAQTTTTQEATAQALNLTISPVTILLDTDPGKPVTSSLRVLNNGLETENLKLEVMTFGADSSGSSPVIKPFLENQVEKDWLKLATDTFSALPNEWTTITFEFSPPENTALSYYYAIVVTRQNQVIQDPSTTTITGAPAVLVLATVNSPNAKQELQLVSFGSKQKVYEFLPSEFEVVIKNTGNVHLSPMGNIFIDAGKKKDVGILSINQGNGLVLPDSQRSYLVDWSDGFPFYQTNPGEKRKLNWDFSKMNTLRMGKYTAHLLMVYDNGERDVPVESTLTFWVIPWRFLLVGAAVVVLAGLGVALIGYLILRAVKKQKSNVKT